MFNRFFALQLFLFCAICPLFSQYSGGFSLNDGNYKALKLKDGNPETNSIIQVKQISLGNGIQVYMDGVAETSTYLDGDYQVELIGSNRPVAIMKISKGLLHGECLLYSYGKLSKKIPYNRGVLDGKSYQYHDDGSQKALITYKSGKLQHEIYHHANGKLKEEESFDENGKKHGKILTYDADGKVIAEANYQHGKYHGRKMEYDNSKCQEIQNYEMGFLVGEYKLIYPNGKTKTEGHYDKNRKRAGKWSQYNEDGTKNKVDEYEQGILHGISATYYANNLLKSSEEYNYGKRNGKLIEYEESPHRIVSEANYKENELDGEFRAYNNGELWRESFYKEGQMIREKQYMDGKIRVLRMLDESGVMVDMRKYDELGKTTYKNQGYKKPASLILIEDSSGIIDIE